jgi:hypothetical protein
MLNIANYLRIVKGLFHNHLVTHDPDHTLDPDPDFVHKLDADLAQTFDPDFDPDCNTDCDNVRDPDPDFDPEPTRNNLFRLFIII